MKDGEDDSRNKHGCQNSQSTNTTGAAPADLISDNGTHLSSPDARLAGGRLFWGLRQPVAEVAGSGPATAGLTHIRCHLLRNRLAEVSKNLFEGRTRAVPATEKARITWGADEF